MLHPLLISNILESRTSKGKKESLRLEGRIGSHVYKLWATNVGFAWHDRRFSGERRVFLLYGFRE